MKYSVGQLIYEGKAKKLFQVLQDDSVVLQEFKNSLTAFNGIKKAELDEKGAVNRDIASLIFRYLKSHGVMSHWIQDVGDRSMVTEKLKIIPLEVVVRNVLAGSLAKKVNRDEGEKLSQPIVDLHFKDDSMGDPFINDDQAVVVFKAATYADIAELKRQALNINSLLSEIFLKCGLLLVDFKLEFGKSMSGQILLADEITPDTCRLWDIKTGEKRDKDRFRRDLGDVIENYKWVLKKLQEEVV